MIVKDERKACVTTQEIRNRLHQAVKNGVATDEMLLDAIGDVTSAAQSWMPVRIETSQITEVVPAARQIELAVSPVRLVTSVVDADEQPVTFSCEDDVLTLSPPPSTGNVTIEYSAGLDDDDLRTCAAVIKRASIRIMTNPSGVVQSGGPGPAFYPEPAGVQAILTKSELTTLASVIPLWGVG